MRVPCIAIIVFICSLAPTGVFGEVLIDPSIAVSETYNSNPLSRSKDQPVDDDYITTISPQIRLRVKQRKYNLNIFYKIDSTTYHEEPANDDISHIAGAGIDADITKKTSIRLRENFRATKDVLLAIDEGIQTSRNDVTYNRVGLDIDHVLSPDTSLTLGVANRRSDFDDPTLINTETETASIGARYHSSKKRSTNLRYTFSNYLFDTGGAIDHNETHTLTAGIDEAISATLDLTLSGGLIHTPDISEDYDWTAEATLTKTLKRTTASFGYNRSISNSSGLSQEITVVDRVDTALDHSLSESISLSVSGAFTKSTSKPSADVDLKSYMAELGLSWRPYTWMAAGIGYSKFKQAPERASTRAVERDIAYLSLTLTPSQWRI